MGKALGPFHEVILGLDPDVPCSMVFVWQHLLQLIMVVTGHKLIHKMGSEKINF